VGAGAGVLEAVVATLRGERTTCASWLPVCFTH
jgi:hypothetical protein